LLVNLWNRRDHYRRELAYHHVSADRRRILQTRLATLDADEAEAEAAMTRAAQRWAELVVAEDAAKAKTLPHRPQSALLGVA
jgi:hypothetical protein